jgi:serine/threonine-protein kinase
MSMGLGFNSYLESFETDHPFGAQVVELFRSAGARPIWVARDPLGMARRAWTLHVRLPPNLEDHFSITRQLVVYCVGSEDLQSRDARRVQALIRDTEGTAESDFSMLISADPHTRTKIGDWAIEKELGGITIVPLSLRELEALTSDTENPDRLREVIGKWISERNLYDERGPVTGERFHGRAHMLRNLDRHLATGGGDIGIFGLRRIGKTSLLHELGDRLKLRDGLEPVFIDLEGNAGGAHVAHRIGVAVARSLADRSQLTERQARKALGLPEHWMDTDPELLIATVGDGIRGLLVEGRLKDHRLILMLDEAEALIPDVENPKPHALTLFRVLRSVSQETRRLNLVLAGVNATPSESPLLAGEDNPLFGSLSVRYLGPLETDECEEMIRKIGRRMQVQWDGPAVGVLTEHVGAHPLLARLAASELVEEFPVRPLRPTVEQAEIVRSRFAETRSPVFEQMVQSLHRYYPSEFEVLQVIADGDQVFAAEMLEGDPSLMNHLAGYGVVSRERLAIRIPAFREWLRQHSRPTPHTAADAG